MKKILFSFLAIIIALNTFAQDRHLRFMDIPLDGKISAFNKELKMKGFTQDELARKHIKGAYIYNGVFAGENAQVFIDYDSKTKIVYQACVIITRYSKESVTQLYENMRDMLEEKYSKDEGVQFFEIMKEELGNKMKEDGIEHFQWKHTSIENGYEATNFLIPNLDKRDLLGVIKIFVSESLTSDIPKYDLYIRYSDWQNSELNRENKMDDL